ncbi:unnamed protein product [Tetraodon nigroviridis]|uniref:MICOS complex subunit n=1 Tax=Tetraodon nigroviridis TaxID=99883 RepID=Q4RTB0_TETNG|nr:unnamed protein product [Tetraodon nigroviridis]
MAAKVAAVAVPAVLGIASIRIYRVDQQPTHGLLPPERLNIYAPLAQSAQAQAVPDQPGVVQRGITTARESIQPFVQASKDAYSSVKTGSVKVYHTLEDVYYYLKDPPPEFVPRFATITLAGLLGMFLARKGSRFKRTVVPLGLMSAAAAVCYPAQAVAALKVTGKKVYSAGRWSSAAVSSLFVPKPQEAVAGHPTPPLPQAEDVPTEESAGSQDASEVQSARDKAGESETATPESAPAWNQPASTVMSEEASSVTPAEIPPAQTPTHTVYPPTLEPEPARAEATSPDSGSSVPDGVADPPQEAAADEAAAEPRGTNLHQTLSADGSGFKADPALMDFGQSSPEDEDLYSTRS